MIFKGRKLVFLFWIVISNMINVYGQQFYDFDGNKVIENDSIQYIYILYADPCCSACVKNLLVYCQELKQATSRLQILFVLKDEMAEYTSKRWAMESVYMYGDTIPIVFDHLKNKSQSIVLRKKIKEFPCVLLVEKEKKQSLYIPYSQIFTDEGLNIEFMITLSKFLYE